MTVALRFSAPAALLSVLLLAGLLGVRGSSTARADEVLPPLPSLRHLVFGFDLILKDEFEKRQETRLRPVLSGRPAPTRDTRVPVTPRTASSDRQLKGQIVCDVVAATADGGLVVDVREDAPERSAGLVRVAIEPNGHLNYPPSKTLFQEEVALLRLLARAVIGMEPHDVGSTWFIEDAGKDYASKMTFRVAAIKPSGDLQVDVDEQYHQDGIDTVSGSVQGKVAYDQAKLVPRNATFGTQVRRETPDGYRVVHMTITVALLEDSFGRR